MGSNPGATSVFRIVRSMPVETSVSSVSVLLVSSASKIALLGSTVAVLLMVPTYGGATRTTVMVVVDSGGIPPPLQVSTLVAAYTAQPPANAGATKLSSRVPIGSGSRTVTGKA